VIFPDYFLFDRICSYSTASNYTAGCSYLSDGRILQKNEGTLQSAWGGYAYNSGTNELIGIAGSALASGIYLDGSATKVGSAAAPNYIYDYNGNLVCDLSKKMIIEYDWRNMPVKFYLYSFMTGTFVHWSDVQTFIRRLPQDIRYRAIKRFNAYTPESIDDFLLQNVDYNSEVQSTDAESA
jgi:hypothetical protein